jgi:hypothetical protein
MQHKTVIRKIFCNINNIYLCFLLHCFPYHFLCNHMNSIYELLLFFPRNLIVKSNSFIQSIEHVRSTSWKRTFPQTKEDIGSFIFRDKLYIWRRNMHKTFHLSGAHGPLLIMALSTPLPQRLDLQFRTGSTRCAF